MGYQDYFRSHEYYFWQWEEQGNVIAVPGGSTIAYKEFLNEIIVAIAAQGLPRFGPLLLVLLVTNENGKNALGGVRKILQQHGYNSELALEFLEMVGDLPSEMKKGDARLRLIQAIFENSHGKYGLNYSTAVKNSIRFDYQISSKEQKTPFDSKYFYQDMRVLEVVAGKLRSKEDIQKRIAGLVEIKEELEIPETEQLGIPAPGFTDFIDLLMEEEKTFQIGALVRHLWGGLNIPAHSSLPSNQPLGGIADLSNKGDFDKLLISEFANDDLVFLSRLANNEALYIQREIPPSHNKFERYLLIDSSIKNWGTPKIVAFATMLAIARHPKTDFECRCFIIGSGWQEVAIETLEELIRAQEILYPGLNSAEGFRDFLKENPRGANREVFFMTERSVLKQASMLRAANELQDQVNYWIHTDDTGGMDIYKRQQGSKRHVQHLQLPLEELWSKRVKVVKYQEEGSLFEGDFPILFHSVQRAEHLLSRNGERFYAVFNGNVLFQYAGELPATSTYYFGKKGWNKIHPLLPLYGMMELGENSLGQDILAIYQLNKNNGVLLNLATMHEQAFRLTEKQDLVNLFYLNGKFIFHSKGEEWAVDPETAVVVHEKNSAIGEKTVEQIIRKREEEVSKRGRLNDSRSILKNVHSVSISDKKTLFFNNHELHLNPTGHIKFISAKKQDLAVAECKGKKTFVFKDGSHFEINPFGMIILTSSNPQIPRIFIPTAMDHVLGMATETAFAGNDFYFKEPLQVVSTAAFFKEYVEPFINTILDHEV
jgi:hypothetical protein